MQKQKNLSFGFVGVEYEGDVLNESKGITATKDLLLSVAAKLK